MKRLRVLTAWLALVAFGGAVDSANAAVKVRYFKGAPTYISTMPTSAVEIAVPELRKGKRVAVAVVALNFGAEPTSLGYENVDIRTTSGEEAKLINYDELRHQAKVRAGWATFFAGVAAGLNSYGAARYGGRGYVGNVPFYSPVGAEMALDRADAENAALFTSIAVTLNSTLERLDGSVLRTTTIDPKTSFGGYVAFDLPKGATVADMVVIVTFGGDTHVVPLNNAAGKLQQATASDLSRGGINGPEPIAPEPTAAKLDATRSARLSSGLESERDANRNVTPEQEPAATRMQSRSTSRTSRMPTPDEFNPQEPQCGMTVTPNGVKLGTCPTH
jgi:hypothetical protein